MKKEEEEEEEAEIEQDIFLKSGAITLTSHNRSRTLGDKRQLLPPANNAAYRVCKVNIFIN